MRFLHWSTSPTETTFIFFSARFGWCVEGSAIKGNTSHQSWMVFLCRDFCDWRCATIGRGSAEILSSEESAFLRGSTSWASTDGRREAIISLQRMCDVISRRSQTLLTSSKLRLQAVVRNDVIRSVQEKWCTWCTSCDCICGTYHELVCDMSLHTGFHARHEEIGVSKPVSEESWKVSECPDPLCTQRSSTLRVCP